MKTNQMMSVDLGGFRLDIEHKTGMGNLTALWEHGNKLRVKSGKQPIRLDNYLAKPETCEYMLEIERDSNSQVSWDLEITDFKGDSNSQLSSELEIEYSERGNTAKLVGGKLTCIKTKRGRYGGTYASLYLLLDAAATLDPGFRYHVYKTFIEGKILQYRDQSGDEYKALCRAMSENGLINDPLDYIRIAKAIRFSVTRTQSHKDVWNTATKEQLQRRTDIETFLTQAIAAGFITGLNMAFDYIAKQRLQ